METKRAELAALAERAGPLERAARAAPSIRPFRAALAAGDEVSLVAECKRRSPGAGAIRPGLDPAALARDYERAGAAALSVLTDRDYFGGSGEDLRAAREATDLPVLRKDFTIDALQVLEARAMGADAVLLIVRILDDGALVRLHDAVRAAGMSALVEVHDAGELERALRLGADLIGINNRDLSTFRTDLETTLRLLDDLPEDVVVVSESGIGSSADVARLGGAGVDAVLVGETLLRADDPEHAAAALTGQPRRSRVRA